MIDRTALADLDDAGLAAALLASAPAIDWPTVGPQGSDVAAAVRARITARPARSRSPWRALPRSVVLALIALLVIAVVATAVGLGLPGLRLTLGGPTPPPTAVPTVAPPSVLPGTGLGIGMRSSLEEAAAATGQPITVPTDDRFGPPGAVWLQMSPARQVTLVWAPSEALPADLDPTIGAILQSFEGELLEPYIEKLIQGGTVVTPVTVGDVDGYWIGGDAHWLMYRAPNGEVVEDGRRWVGDALIWSDGDVTYRLETGLGREATISIAEGLTST